MDAIEDLLEFEIGASILTADGGVAVPIDLLVKKPFTLTRWAEVMVGISPEVVQVTGADKGTYFGAELALDFMFWPWGRHVGVWVEPEYDLVFHGRATRRDRHLTRWSAVRLVAPMAARGSRRGESNPVKGTAGAPRHHIPPDPIKLAVVFLNAHLPKSNPVKQGPTRGVLGEDAGQHLGEACAVRAASTRPSCCKRGGKTGSS